MTSERCTCGECRDLDRQHPAEGWQMRLLPVGVATEPEPLAVPSVSPERITSLLRRTRLRIGTEDALQLSIADALAGGGVPFEREVRLGPGERIDFLCGSVGIEAKARYAKRAIFRQLERYAAHEMITALILVTGTAMGLPASLNGKPVFLVSIGRASL